ncbi:hypothetical protein [Microbacterium sp. LWH3-1.2]|uniref:hypothetical protein n=1 Tax=Microbacterium sp. LWH3-1.2 TaxID=3135256 RepID=UPI003433C832
MSHGDAGPVPPHPDRVDGGLLRLLLRGVTGAAAAAQFGISLRTRRRRVAEVMETAGVTTRTQLGAETVRRNWA